MSSKPIRVLLIQPDNTYEIATIKQDLATMRKHIGGYLEAATTEYAIFWCDEEGKLKGKPSNQMATYLWWTLNPNMEAVDVLCGSVVVTGGADPNGDCLPIPQPIIDLFQRMENVREASEGPAGSEAPSP